MDTPQEEKALVYVERCQNLMAQASATFQSANTLANSFGAVTQNVTDTVKLMQQIDLNFKLAIKHLDNDIEKFRLSVPLVNDSLNNIYSGIQCQTNKLVSLFHPGMNETELKGAMVLQKAIEQQNILYNNWMMAFLSK